MNDLELTQPAKPVKPCRKCGAVDRSPSGNCRPCSREAVKRWREANPEANREARKRCYAANRDTERERSRRYREANPKAVRECNKRWHEANREARSEYDKRYREANREARSEYNKRWRETNPEANRERGKRWVAENPEAKRVHNHNRRARIRSSGKLSPDIASRLLTAQKGKCACCKTKMESYHIDHIMPLALGGLNVDNNVQLLCPPCNLSKGAKHPVDFAQERGLLL